MFFFSKSIAASYSTHFPLWVQQLEVLFCFICAVAKFNAVAGTTRRHGLHDNRKAFGLREMAHVFPGLTSNGETMPSLNLQWLSGFFNASKHNNPTKKILGSSECLTPKRKAVIFSKSFWNWATTNGTNRSQACYLHGILLELSVMSILYICSTISTQTQKLRQGICHLQKWLEKWGEVWVSHFLTRCFVRCFMKITQLWPGLDASFTAANHSKRVCLCCMAQGLCSQRQVGFLVDLGKAGSIFITPPSTYDSSTKTKLQKPSWWSYVESY